MATKKTSTVNSLNEKVKIKLFKDNGKYKEDVFVAVNGKKYKIPRGVEVSVPKKVANILDRSELQDEKTARLIEKESNSFKNESRIFG